MRNQIKFWRFASVTLRCFALLGLVFVQALVFSSQTLAAEAAKKKPSTQASKSPSIKSQVVKSKSPTQTRQAASQEDDVHVIVLDPDLAAEELESQGLQVHDGHSYENKPGQIPPKHHLEMIFAQSGVLPYVERMDGMGRDMLFMRCEYSTVEQLRANYPQIPKKKLAELKKRIQVYRQQGM